MPVRTLTHVVVALVVLIAVGVFFLAAIRGSAWIVNMFGDPAVGVALIIGAAIAALVIAVQSLKN